VQVFCAPFRSGAAHIVIFRAILSHRTSEAGSQERSRCAGAAADQGDQVGLGERKLLHVIPHANDWNWPM
jgi:hypothetical protein